MTYDDDKLKAIQEEMLAILPDYVSAPRGRDLSNAEINAYMRDLSVCLSVLIFWLALYFKHPAYTNEAEYRLLQIQQGDRPADGVKMRARPYGLVRYIEYEWKKYAPTALKEIIIGPAADENKSRRFARDCAIAFGLDPNSIVIRKSSIPYRGR